MGRTRDTLFVSHASPEDNEFSRWLALRLAAEGYRVWSDITELLGGERFWDRAEEAIRTQTAKFLYVLSRTSNIKQGPRDELNVAANVEKSEILRDFVIPLHIDDLPYSEVNVQLSAREAIEFHRQWGAGFARLLAKLDKARVPKVVSNGRDVAAAWWKLHVNRESDVLEGQESCASNWYPFAQLPRSLQFYRAEELPAVENLAAAAVPYEESVISFAGIRELAPQLSSVSRKPHSHAVELGWFLDGGDNEYMPDRVDARNILVRLLRESWSRRASASGFLRHNMSRGLECHYLPISASPSRVRFRTPEGRDTYRDLVGYATLKRLNGERYRRYWHLAVSAKPQLTPMPLLALRSHVLFTFDGQTVTSSKAMSQAARRSQCSSWFNLKWRDLLLAYVSRLAAGSGSVRLQGADNTAIDLDANPIAFESPVTYIDPKIVRACLSEEDGDELVDDEQAD